MKRKFKFEIDGFKQEWSLKEKDIDRLKKEIQKLKRKATWKDLDSSQISKTGDKLFSKKKSIHKISSARKSKDQLKQAKDLSAKAVHRRSKARGNSSHRSKSRDKASDSWMKRNSHLAWNKSKVRAKSRGNSSGIPLYRNKSTGKVTEKDSKK